MQIVLEILINNLIGEIIVMGTSRHTGIQKHATEKAILIDLVNSVNKAATELKTSLGSYINTTYISSSEIPANRAVLDEVLQRFYNFHNLDSLYNLVDKHPELIDKAIEFTRNPSTNTFRTSYNQAEAALKQIKSNLEEYRKLDTFKTVSESKDSNGKTIKLPEPIKQSNHDGFKNYCEKVGYIKDLEGSFSKLVEYAKGAKLDANDLPKTVAALQATIKALPMPGVKVEQKDATEQSKLPQDGDRFEVGSEEDLALHNKAAYDGVTRDITNDKMLCFNTPLLKRMEYNKCVNENAENVDAKCASKNTEYEISKANCESHYPMVTISDEVISNLFTQIEISHATFANGVYKQDNDNAMGAVGGFLTMIDTVNSAPLTIAPSISHEDDSDKVEKTKTAIHQSIALMGYDATLLIGEGYSSDESN